ncbi:MAG: DUF3048 domain-containing protein [Patescibacteria group bacterium]
MNKLSNQLKALVEKAKKIDWKKVDKRRVSVGVTVVALTLIAISIFNLQRNGYLSDTTGEPKPADDQLNLSYRHPLTGTLSENPVDRPQVYAVMVENSSDAWPQAGVEQAFLVIEAPAEGGIPRFEAFYGADQDVEKIGPVRSARPYFIDLASIFRPLYAHVGGSSAAIAQIGSEEDILDFDEYYNQYQFWRAADRLAPHNVFTSTELLAKGLKLRYPSETVFEYDLWEFKDDVDLVDRPGAVADMVINFGASVYRVTWKYDREANTYKRFEGTTVQAMEDGTELTAHNIAIIETNMQVLDFIGRLSVRTTGEGNGLFLQDGKAIEVTWKREATTDLMRFYDKDGKEVKMNAGQTWIEIVGSLNQVD